MSKSLSVRFHTIRTLLEFQKNTHIDLNPPDELNSLDQRWFTQVIQGVMQHLRWLESEVDQRLRMPKKKQEKALRVILIQGLYELKFLEKVPARATIHSAVEMTRKFKIPHRSGMVNGVLRQAQRDWESNPPSISTPPLGVKYSIPDWMLKRWQRQYSEDDVEQICMASNQFDGITLIPLESESAQKLQEDLEQEGITVEIHPILSSVLWVANAGTLFETEAFRQGRFYIQDASSHLFLEVMKPFWKGDVLDLCSAPGGKAFYIAQQSNVNSLTVNDVSASRLQTLQHNLKRLQLEYLECHQWDGTQLSQEGRFWDVLLLDVPCSATGTLKKNPDLKWKYTSEKELLDKIPLQQQLLKEAARCVKPKGYLIYSTCSLEKEENEEQLQHFLKNHSNFRSVDLGDIALSLSTSLKWETNDGFYQVLPQRGMMGFFAGVLQNMD